jgi:hypothetical protein
MVSLVCYFSLSLSDLVKTKKLDAKEFLDEDVGDHSGISQGIASKKMPFLNQGLTRVKLCRQENPKLYSLFLRAACMVKLVWP